MPREKVYGQPTKECSTKALLSAPRCVFSAATHTKALKTAFLRENNILALEGLRNEDITLSAMIIHHAKSYDRYNYVVHAYRRSNISSLSARAENSIEIATDVLKQFHLLLSNEEYKNDRNVLDFLASPFVYWLGKIIRASCTADKAYTARINAEIKAGSGYFYVLRYSSRPYVRAVGIIQKLFGTRFVIFLIRAYLTVNRRHMLSVRRKL